MSDTVILHYAALKFLMYKGLKSFSFNFHSQEDPMENMASFTITFYKRTLGFRGEATQLSQGKNFSSTFSPISFHSHAVYFTRSLGP